jgi:hypothetical protein
MAKALLTFGRHLETLHFRRQILGQHSIFIESISQQNADYSSRNASTSRCIFKLRVVDEALMLSWHKSLPSTQPHPFNIATSPHLTLKQTQQKQDDEIQPASQPASASAILTRSIDSQQVASLVYTELSSESPPISLSTISPSYLLPFFLPTPLRLLPARLPSEMTLAERLCSRDEGKEAGCGEFLASGCCCCCCSRSASLSCW